VAGRKDVLFVYYQFVFGVLPALAGATGCKQAAFAGKPSGFRVFASDLNLDSIEDLRLEGIEVLALDVTTAESVQRGVSHVEQEAGRLDVLVCNAGIVTIAPLIEEDLSEIQAVWNVNT